MTIARTTHAPRTKGTSILKRLGVGLAAVALAGGAVMGVAPEAGAVAPEQVASSGGWQPVETPDSDRPLDSVKVEDAVVGDTVQTPFLDLTVRDVETSDDARPISLSDFEDFEAADIDRTLVNGDCFTSNATVKVAPDTGILGVAYTQGDWHEPGGYDEITWHIEQDG